MWVAGIFASALAVLKFISDWIGRSTVPEDAVGLVPAFYRLTNWLSELSPFWVYVVAIILILALCRLLWQGDPANFTRRIQELEGENATLQSRLDQLQDAMAPRLAVSSGSIIVPDRIDSNTGSLTWTIDLRNLSAYETVEDVEVKIVECWRKKPTSNKMEINRNIALSRSGETKFDMLPGIDRQLIIAQTPFLDASFEAFTLGPFDGTDERKNLIPGQYKITVTVFARDMHPIVYHLGITFQDNGCVSFGDWVEGVPYPSMAIGTGSSGELVVSPTSNPEPQSPPDTAT